MRLKFNFNETKLMYGLSVVVFTCAIGLLGWFVWQYFATANFTNGEVDITNTKNEQAKKCDFRRALDGVCVDSVENTNPKLVAVMIENHTDSRPQSGLTAADVVYEAVAEGGITRFGVVFYCGVIAKDTKLAPVRSARTYFLDWASEYNFPLYVHVGGGNCSRDEGTKQCTSDPRAQAIEQIEKYGWGGSKGNDLNQFSIGYPTFWRNYERLGRTVATEHTMETTSEKLWAVGMKRGWTAEGNDGEEWSKKFVPWTFTGGVKESDRGTVNNISFEFWEGYQDFTVRWEYNPQTNLYGRIMGGQPHKDLETGSTIIASAVIIQFVKEEGPVDIHKHMIYGTTGKGDALVFQNGLAIKAKWQKTDRISRTKFTDEKGKEISFVGGQMWIEVVPAGNTVEY